MPRQLAILVFTLFTVWLWREDKKSRPHLSKALWIPLMWLLLLGSRPLSWWSWFFFGIGSSASSDLEGNGLDRAFYSALICLSLIIIVRRRVSWNEVFGGNTGLVLFYAFLGLTIIWSAYPFPTFKRWTKEIGAIPVLLIILTDTNPIEAIKVIFTRCAYVLFAFSVLTIKYIPEIARDYNRHSGLAEIHGIAQQKNSLGESAAVFGLIVVWQLLDSARKRPRDYFKAPVLQWVITILMGLWLLHQCGSLTSMIALGVGTALLLSTKIRFFENKRLAIVWICLVAVPIFFLLDHLLGISQPLLTMLGRDATLTNRTEIWKAVASHPVNPVFGCGYLNFWDVVGAIDLEGGEADLKTAHNGYLEIFLDGGYLGILFLIIMLVNVGINQARSFVRAYPAGAIGLAFFCMTLLNNVSESVFARRGPLWSTFLMTAVGYWFLAHAPTEDEISTGASKASECAVKDNTFEPIAFRFVDSNAIHNSSATYPNR
jgi:Lipid A core - O-antigen ligase and related enzymes